jgi:hypothetical protein
MIRGLGVVALTAVVATTTASATGVPLKAFARPHHTYDNLPPAVKSLAPDVANARRVATAIDNKRNTYLVYVTLMKNNQVCAVLTQGSAYSERCTPQPILFVKGRQSFSVFRGLLGGVVGNDVIRIVLVGHGRQISVPLTTDHGFIFGCPAPSACASWVKAVVGYNSAGKVISRETVA